MMLPDPPSLSPDERDLAQQLRQLGPHGEPSPAMDARILAAGRAAAGTTTRRHHRPRWPVALGLAASLVVAIGLAWRMRPLPPPPAVDRSQAATSMEHATGPSDAPAPQPPLAQRKVDASDTVEGAPDAQPRPAEPRVTERDAPQSRTGAAAEPLIVFDEPAPAAGRQASVAPLPAAAPPPPAPALPAEPAQPAMPPAGKIAAPAATAERSVAATGDSAAQASNEASRAALASQVGGSAATAGSDEPSDDVPPATVDTPAVRDAWLQRIRDLIGSGDIPGARASLHEFVRRYPTYPLPEDLRALER